MPKRKMCVEQALSQKEVGCMKRSFAIWKASCALLGGLLLLGAVSTHPAAAYDEFPQRNAWTRATPSVVWCGDPTSTTTLEVHIVGRNDVARVWITGLWLPGVMPQEEDGRAELFDDGTHGDSIAGDNVFTLADVLLPCSPDYLAEQGGIGNWWGFLRVELRNGTRLGNDYGMQIGMVHPDYKDFFAVQDFGNGLSATAYAFFIEDSDHEVLDGYPVATLTCGQSNFNAYRKLYSVLPDAFDIALVMPGMQIFRSDNFGENVPYNVLVSNHVEHIGMPIMDNTARFGSAGRLKSTIYHSFGDIDIFDHEIGHTWGMSIGQSLGLIHETYAVAQGHWSEYADIQGQMGAYYFDPGGAIGHFAYNGDETWHLIANTEVEPYSPLELYVMGLIPAEEVPPIHILTAPNLSDPMHITAASYRTVTIEQMMQAEGGPRNPPYIDSQKEFTLAFIVTQDRPFDDAAYAYFSLMSHELMRQEGPRPHHHNAPFYWATGGRATLTSRLPLDLPDPFAQPPAATETPTATFTPVRPTPTPAATATTAPTEESEPASPLCGSSALVGLLILPLVWGMGRRK
jgi:hypothetical protein